MAKAPELFELLCDCVEWDADKRPDMGSLIEKIGALSSQYSPKPTTVVSKKTVEKNVEVEAPRQQVDNRIWWNQLDGKWKNIFKEAINIETEPSDSELVEIVHLQKLDCFEKEISDLEPLRQLANLQNLDCSNNKISDLEPLRQLVNLQSLNCYDNQISDLEPLHQLTNLQSLNCCSNQISQTEIDKFKKAVPNCKVIS